MIVDNIEIVTILTILLFGVPLIISAVKSDILKKFSFSLLTRTFNKTFLPQIIVAVIVIITAVIFDNVIYKEGHGNILTDIWMGLAYTYLIIGSFIYIPLLLILNLLNFLIKPKNIQTNE